jgi:hypothetical protein
MDNNKIEIKYVIIFFIILIIIFSWIIHKKDTIEENHYSNYQIEIQSLQDSFNIAQKTIDSLTIVATSKKATIINNTYIYEAENKKIGSASYSFTDSLFKANLQSGYKNYGYLIQE